MEKTALNDEQLDNISKLAEWNNITDQNFLMVGQPLKVKF